MPYLDKRLWEERDRVLFLLLTDFDFQNVMHYRMLRTVYTKLTHNCLCPVRGNHWQDIGFDSVGDPCISLNHSNGLLNIVHLFYLFEKNFPLLNAIHQCSVDPEHKFPLARVSIKITQMVVDAFLCGKISKMCNKGSESVVTTTCQVYAGGLHYFYSRWRSLKRTMHELEITLSEVQKGIMSRASKLVEELQKSVENQKARMNPARLQYADLDSMENRSAKIGETPIPERLQAYGVVEDVHGDNRMAI